MTSKCVTILVVLCFTLACLVASAQTIQKTAVSPTSPSSGAEMFKTYCAACHGADGKGTGPAATALKKTPANLTELTARNGGKFPELKVYGTIKGDVDTPAHGSRDMPVWGSLFSGISRGNQAEVQLRISNLTAYVQSIQGK